MPLLISDELLNEASITEQEAQLEIACRLFDAGRLTLPQAIHWSGLTRTAFESALLERDIPIVRPSLNDFQDDLETLARLRS